MPPLCGKNIAIKKSLIHNRAHMYIVYEIMEWMMMIIIHCV